MVVRVCDSNRPTAKEQIQPEPIYCSHVATNAKCPLQQVNGLLSRYPRMKTFPFRATENVCFLLYPHQRERERESNHMYYRTFEKLYRLVITCTIWIEKNSWMITSVKLIIVNEVVL